jgi:hypothetical protein
VADFGRDKGRLQFPGKPSPSQNGAARATNKTFCLQAAASVAKGAICPACSAVSLSRIVAAVDGSPCAVQSSLPALIARISGEGVGLGHASPEDRYA